MTVSGSGFELEPQLPEVRLGGVRATVTHASTRSLSIVVPPGLNGGHTPIRVDSAQGETGVRGSWRADRDRCPSSRQPGVRREGNLYVTFSGSRGQEAPVSIYVVRRDGIPRAVRRRTAQPDIDGH